MATFTQAELDALKRAVYLNKTKTVEFNGRQVEYSSFKEMKQRIAAIEREIQKDNSTKKHRVYGINSRRGI